MTNPYDFRYNPYNNMPYSSRQNGNIGMTGVKVGEDVFKTVDSMRSLIDTYSKGTMSYNDLINAVSQLGCSNLQIFPQTVSLPSGTNINTLLVTFYYNNKLYKINMNEQVVKIPNKEYDMPDSARQNGNTGMTGVKVSDDVFRTMDYIRSLVDTYSKGTMSYNDLMNAVSQLGCSNLQISPQTVSQPSGTNINTLLVTFYYNNKLYAINMNEQVAKIPNKIVPNQPPTTISPTEPDATNNLTDLDNDNIQQAVKDFKDGKVTVDEFRKILKANGVTKFQAEISNDIKSNKGKINIVLDYNGKTYSSYGIESEKDVNTLREEIAESDNNAKAETAAEAIVAKNKEQREADVKNIREKYIDTLKDYKGADTTFDSKTTAIKQKYINDEISKEDFEKQMKAVASSILKEEKAKIAEAKDNALKKKAKTIAEKEFSLSVPSNAQIVTNADGTLMVTINDKDGSKTVQKYNSLKQKISEISYDKNGKKTSKVSITYDSSYVCESKTTVVYNSDGSYSVFRYNATTHAVTRKDYDKNGKDITKTGKSVVDSKKGSCYGGWTSSKELYTMITKSLKKSNGWLLGTTEELICMMVDKLTGISQKDYSTLTSKLLAASQANASKPSGSTTVYNSYAETPYAEYIRKDLLKALKASYGYDPEDVKGYFFPSSSELSKTIAKDKDTKSFIKNNIKDLISGKGLPKALSLTSTKDLYYSVHNCRVLGSKLTGKTLTLQIYDLYDFDIKDLDKLTTSTSTSTALGAAGAAAMKDGKLVPYYHISEVKIDLSTIYSAAELKKLGIS